MPDGGGGNQTTQKNEPPDVAKPYLKQIYTQGQNWYNSAKPSYYPGSTLAPMAPAETQALSGMMNRALAGSPGVKAAQGYVTDTLEGRGLSDELYNSIESRVKPSVNSTFASGGRYGSGSHAYELARGLTEGYAPVQAQNLQWAAGAAPGLADQDYKDLAVEQQVGQRQQQQSQAAIDADIQKFNYNQQLPYNKLAQYLSLITGATGNYGTTTTSQPSTPIWQQLASLLTAGAGTAGNLGWSPFG